MICINPFSISFVKLMLLSMAPFGNLFRILYLHSSFSMSRDVHETYQSFSIPQDLVSDNLVYMQLFFYTILCFMSACGRGFLVSCIILGLPAKEKLLGACITLIHLGVCLGTDLDFICQSCPVVYYDILSLTFFNLGRANMTNLCFKACAWQIAFFGLYLISF